MKGFLKLLRLIPFGIRFVVKALVKLIFHYHGNDSINVDIDGDGHNDIIIVQTLTPNSKQGRGENHKEEKKNDSN